MPQESLEETKARLGLSTAPVTNQRTARQYSPTPAPVTPPVNGRGALRIAVAFGVIAAIGVVGFNVFQAIPEVHLDDEWTDYPGSYFESDDYVLAADSLETQQANGDALLGQFQDELADYGFTWDLEREGEVDHSSNGYNGESMLYDYQSDSFIGSAQVSDPDAREDIVRIFSTLFAAQDDSTIVINNDEIDGEDDATLQFGSADRDAQALWSAWSYADHFTSLQGDITVYDSTVPTDEQFGNDYWVPEDTTDTLFVRIQVTAYYLLSEHDRAAFIAALEPYEGETRPAFRG